MKYKLLKELPGADVAVGNVYEGKDGSYRFVGDDRNIAEWLELFIENFKDDPEWFEQIEDRQKWHPNPDDMWYMVDDELNVQEYSWTFTAQKYDKLGNCFATKVQAECLAEALRAVIAWTHKPYDESEAFTEDVIRPINNARKAVQEDI